MQCLLYVVQYTLCTHTHAPTLHITHSAYIMHFTHIARIAHIIHITHITHITHFTHITHITHLTYISYIIHTLQISVSPTFAAVYSSWSAAPCVRPQPGRAGLHAGHSADQHRAAARGDHMEHRGVLPGRWARRRLLPDALHAVATARLTAERWLFCWRCLLAKPFLPQKWSFSGTPTPLSLGGG